MNSTTPSVLILGGGVAGLSAAQTLSGLNLAVHLVEKEKTLGGNAARWACMATQNCENCGACLSIELADLAPKQDNLTLHLGTTVKTIDKDRAGYNITLENNEKFSIQKVIMATGFSPFNPEQTRSLSYSTLEKVISTADLNTAMQEDKLAKLLDNKKDPKIAFIQCVGSRNREQGRDYCSQVCCKISMRHANKLAYLYPEADIACFHMDLQVIGKEIRPLFDTLSQNIKLVQGVPAEILESQETDSLSIITEDKENSARKSAEFDIVVLSVGMQPCDDLESTSGLLNIKPNSWGFFNTEQVETNNDIHLAGCARGPKDILSSKQDGQLAAAKVAEELNLATDSKKTVLVWGSGPQADAVAAGIAAQGLTVYLTGKGETISKDTNISPLNEEQILGVNGTCDNFSVLYQTDGRKKKLECSSIIAANEPNQIMPEAEGLPKKTEELTDFAKMIGKDPGSCPENTIILLDYAGPELKYFSRLALETAIKIREADKSVSIVMNKMLVHGPQGQNLYDSARKSGADFFRFETIDDIQINDQKNIVSIKEATLSGLTLDLSYNTLVVPPAVLPAQEFKETAALLKQDLDAQGFLQSANTRHRLVQSPRKGIFFAGTGHDETDAVDLETEIQAIASIINTAPVTLKDNYPGIKVNPEACAHCLTCYRVCPHNALIIDEDNTPKIVAEACFACHLCVSNCPAYAISSDTLANDQLAAKTGEGQTAIMACERSAALAAEGVKTPDHVDLIRIPCACRVSNDVILKMLLSGASKVIVAGCHTNNCQSTKGSAVASESVKKVLSIPGLDSSQVRWEPVAANEPKKLEALF